MVGIIVIKMKMIDKIIPYVLILLGLFLGVKGEYVPRGLGII